MSTTRRKFLAAGMLAGIAAVPLRNIFGQSWKERDGNPSEIPDTQNDPLINYSKASFKSYLNSIFQLHTVFGVIEVALMQVDDMPAARGGECFSLLFRGGSRALRQDTYVLVHPALGTFSLLLVPTGADRNGAQGYVATINRLSFIDALSNPAPTRQRSEQPEATPVNTATPTATPTVTPTEAAPATTPAAPVVTSPAQPTAPAGKVNRRPKRRKKPSWKDVDQRIH